MAFLAYSNRMLGAGTFADTGSAYATSPPISNLGKPQTPSPHAEFTGASAEFSFQALDGAGSPETFSFQCLALIGHTLPDSAVITWKRGSDDSTIATQTWARFKNRPMNSIILLNSAITDEHTIKCAITSAGSGTKRIAAAWAGPVWSFQQIADFAWTNSSDAEITRISGTDWAWADTRRRGVPVTAIGTRGEIIGLNADGTEYSGNDAETVLHEAGVYQPVILCLSDTSATRIAATTIYGALDDAGTPEQVSGDVYRVSFSVTESR